ncbi:hypothetical protein GW931_01795 [archaeon]|nr:hypothetical protein [archaeon]PJC45632.1 MAG: hypothetical protein CO037_00485 [Candidatus Pacearchaeota archaeon CG_4_9_14_0_2_um_filter_30_8]
MEKINKKRVDKLVGNINDSDKEVSWEEGQPKFKSKLKIQKGKSSRARGARFELKVRHDLEEKGRFIDKWNNNVDLESQKMVIAKKKFNPFLKAMTLGTGFPDFISIAHVRDEFYSVIGVECKINGILSKTEKEKCIWYLEKKVFSQIWIAKEKRNGKKIEIEYVDFKERYIK